MTAQTIPLSLDAGSLGTLRGTLNTVSSVVLGESIGMLTRTCVARTLRGAVEDGRIEVPAGTDTSNLIAGVR